MWAFLLLTLFMLFTVTFGYGTRSVLDSNLSVSEVISKSVIQAYGNALEDYLRVTSVQAPSDIDELVNTQGYEYLASIRPNDIGYAVTTITDRRLTYQRVLIYIQPVGNYKTRDEYLSATNNQCGTEGFDSAQEWCVNDGSIWFLTDNRKVINEQIQETTYQLDVILQKFAYSYQVEGVFPNKKNDSTVIADNSSVSLSDAVGYTDTPGSCSGHFDFYGAPLTCNNLFDVAGNPIIYHRHNDQFISVYTVLPYLDSAGENLVYSRNLEVY